MPDVFRMTTERNGKSMGSTQALAGRLRFAFASGVTKLEGNRCGDPPAR